ncbi:MAG: DSD1 family PLP-dependent enzyme, partial [Fuerstia sp.]|nr:DSD1 family PLP-dependent enzyme [Fuerstiella sp.]
MAGVATIAASDPRIGRPLTELDTPTLLLDRAASDRNLARM